MVIRKKWPESPLHTILQPTMGMLESGDVRALLYPRETPALSPNPTPCSLAPSLILALALAPDLERPRVIGLAPASAQVRPLPCPGARGDGALGQRQDNAA